MAIDTRAKRFSMLNFGWLPIVALFEADGSVDADDRAHMLNMYAGIPLSGPGPPPENVGSNLLTLGVS